MSRTYNQEAVDRDVAAMINEIDRRSEGMEYMSSEQLTALWEFFEDVEDAVHTAVNAYKGKSREAAGAEYETVLEHLSSVMDRIGNRSSTAPMSPGYQVPYDFFSPRPSPPHTGGFEITEFPPKGALSFSESQAKHQRKMSAKPDGVYRYERTTKPGGKTVYSYLLVNGGEKKFISLDDAEKYIERGFQPFIGVPNPDRKPRRKLDDYRVRVPGGGYAEGRREIEYDFVNRHSYKKASLIPARELRYVAKVNGVPQAVASNIIRDADVLMNRELESYKRGGLGARIAGYSDYVAPRSAPKTIEQRRFEAVARAERSQKVASMFQ